MARRRKEAETEDEAARTAAKRRTRDTVSQVAHALRHRDQIVREALAFLEETGFIDGATHDRVLAAYEVGDGRTRLAIQELVARVLRVPLDRLDAELLEGQLDPARVSTHSLADLEALVLPQVDVEAVAERVRAFDVDRLVARGAGDNKVVRLVTDIPVHLNRLRLGLLFGGLVLLLLVAAALVFPGATLYILLYGLLVLLAVLGGLMVTWAVRLERGAKELGLDLVVFSRLDREERRVLVARRLLVHLVDPRRLGDLVEKGLHAVLPERMRAPGRDDVVPPAARPRPARPHPRPEAPREGSG